MGGVDSVGLRHQSLIVVVDENGSEAGLFVLGNLDGESEARFSAFQTEKNTNDNGYQYLELLGGTPKVSE